MSLHYDIVIVGAGASGAAAAWNLSKKFKRIACLEQGDWVKAETYPSNFNDWEIQKTSNFSPFPNVRKQLCIFANHSFLFTSYLT